ncbi:MAG: CBS domain-containing protein [Thermomicrobiales bacterium]
MTTSEVFQQTLERLDGNLTVSLVATQHPMMFHVDDDLDDTLAIMRLNDFSQAPVVDGTAVVGVVEDSRINSGGLVGRVTVPLSGRMLLSERAGLRSTIRLLSTSEFGYRLVVGGKGIEALVTRSDLQKLPVR